VLGPPTDRPSTWHSHQVGADPAVLVPRAELFPELTDAQAHDLIYDSVFATDAGLGFYVDGDSTRDFARAVDATDGYVTLDLHGGRDGFYIDGHRLTPEQLAGALRDLHADGYVDLPEGTGIKLLSCDTAFGGDDSPAAALARELGLEVIAPDQVVWTSMVGEEIVSSPMAFGGYIIPKYPPDGSWHQFGPSGHKVGLDFDPGYHGPAVDGSRPLSQFNPDPPDEPWYDTDRYDTDRYDTDRYDTDRYDTDRYDSDPHERDTYSANAYDYDDDWADRSGRKGNAELRADRSPGGRREPSGGVFGTNTPGTVVFPGTTYSLHEIVEFCNGHTGDQNPGLRRPTPRQIERALREAVGVGLPGQNARAYVHGDVKVIINHDHPLRSSAWLLTRAGR
jgi:hypothetical protein